MIIMLLFCRNSERATMLNCSTLWLLRNSSWFHTQRGQINAINHFAISLNTLALFYGLPNSHSVIYSVWEDYAQQAHWSVIIQSCQSKFIWGVKWWRGWRPRSRCKVPECRCEGPGSGRVRRPQGGKFSKFYVQIYILVLFVIFLLGKTLTQVFLLGDCPWPP